MNKPPKIVQMRSEEEIPKTEQVRTPVQRIRLRWVVSVVIIVHTTSACDDVATIVATSKTLFLRR